METISDVSPYFIDRKTMPFVFAIMPLKFAVYEFGLHKFSPVF
jgi:hypothetical protein